MRYYGEFVNQKGKVVSVDIHTVGDENITPIIIGDNGIYFASEEAVIIESDVNDTFDTRLCTNCTIQLLSNRALTDFYTLMPQEAAIKVDVDGKAIFRGYVQPLAFSQPFVEELDDVTIEAVSPLSVLESVPYARDFDAAIAQVKERSILEILTDALERSSVGLDLSIDIDCPVLTSDGTAPAIEAFSLSESLFLGEEDDDIWMLEDVVDEILRYFDLKAEVRGESLSVYRSAPKTKDVIITQDLVADAEATLNIEEAFNKISVTAQREPIEDILPDPLDEDMLTSEYSRPALYSRMFVVNGNKWNYDDFYRFATIGIPPSGTTDDTYDLIESYIKPMTHPQWLFKEGAIYTPLPSQGPLDGMMGNANACGNTISAGIFRIGTVKPLPTKKNNEIPSKIDYDDAIVIGVGGERNGWPTPFDLSANTGVAKYTGSSMGMALTPADPDTTNYILISGKLMLMPYLIHIYRSALDLYTPQPGNGVTGEVWIDYYKWKNAIDSKGFYDGSGKQYHLLCQWFNCEKATDTPVLQMEQERGLLTANEGIGKFLKVDDIVENETDRISKVGVLRCMLRVGDKVLTEFPSIDATGSGIIWNGNSALLWTTYKERKDCVDDAEYLRQTFSLGFNPELGKYIVGEEHDITNTVHYGMNIDEEGLAIPIPHGVHLRGKIQFEILGPIDLHFCKSGAFNASSEAQRVMPYVNYITLTGFKMGLYSNNGRVDFGDDDDIIYTSDTDERYINESDDITMRINTALTTAERAELGISDSPSLSVPFDATTQAPALSVLDDDEEGKPEQFYVDRHWRETHKPRIEMEINLEGTDWMIGDILHHPAMPDKIFRIMAVGYDAQSGFSSCRLREQC